MPDNVLWVPLQFWIRQHQNQALPLFALYNTDPGIRTVIPVDDSVLDGVARLYAEPAEGAAEPAGTGAGSAPHTL